MCVPHYSGKIIKVNATIKNVVERLKKAKTNSALEQCLIRIVGKMFVGKRQFYKEEASNSCYTIYIFNKCSQVVVCVFHERCAR